MKDWRKVQGSQAEKPQEFDTETSAVVVYQRKNIKRVTAENMDGTTAEFWEYDERELSRDEYYALTGETARENAAKIIEVDETALTGLMATTDLYEELIAKGVL